MSSDDIKIALLIVSFVVVGLALFFLQEWHRRGRRVSQQDREREEKRSMLIWQAFILGLLAIGTLFVFASESDLWRRLVLVAWSGTMGFFAWRKWQEYLAAKRNT